MIRNLHSARLGFARALNLLLLLLLLLKRWRQFMRDVCSFKFTNDCRLYVDRRRRQCTRSRSPSSKEPCTGMTGALRVSSKLIRTAGLALQRWPHDFPDSWTLRFEFHFFLDYSFYFYFLNFQIYLYIYFFFEFFVVEIIKLLKQFFFINLFIWQIFSHSLRHGSNACANQTDACPFLCTGLPNGARSCLCPDGMKVVADPNAGEKCLCPGGSLPQANGTCSMG